jgi:glycosyl transferase, family 25
MKTISDIKHAFYINLETRPDRKEHVEKQMELIGIHATRFKAIQLQNGALGCSMSHLKILENAKKNNLEHVLIVEDDILFTKPDTFVSQLNNFLSNHSDFDVVLVAGNNKPPYKTIDDTCIQITECQTTTGYLVQNHYFNTLIGNFREGIQKLMIEPHKHTSYAIDKYWFNLQKIHKWYLITPLTVTQREDYSDIEKRTTNYSRAMLDIDKEAFFRWQMEQQIEQQMKYQMKQLAASNIRL